MFVEVVVLLVFYQSVLENVPQKVQFQSRNVIETFIIHFLQKVLLFLHTCVDVLPLTIRQLFPPSTSNQLLVSRTIEILDFSGGRGQMILSRFLPNRLGLGGGLD